MINTTFILLGLAALACSTLLCACQSAPRHSAGASPKLRIQVLGFESCPNTPLMRERVVQAARAIRGAEVSSIDLMELDENDARRGWPAPTVLVNDRDLFGMPAPTSNGMGCRHYPGGVPSVADIAAKLESLKVNL